MDERSAQNLKYYSKLTKKQDAMPTVVDFDTLSGLFLELTKQYKDTYKTAFAYKPDPQSGYQALTWDQVYEDVSKMATFYLQRGIEHGDRVAILSENRYEWAVADLAMQMTGAVNVSLFTSLTAAQCEYIINDSGAKLLLVSTGIQLKKAIDVYDNCDSLQEIVAFDTPKNAGLTEHRFVTMYNGALKEGLLNREGRQDELHRRAEAVTPDDLTTLIYTSGTTGKPKGAMLTHNNIVRNLKEAHMHIDIYHTDRCLSFLPLSHSFERTTGYYAMMAGGAEIYYAESIDTVAKNMTEVQPTLMMSVPRLFERIYNLVTKSIEEGPKVKKKIFEWAMEVGRKYAEGKRGMVAAQKKVADKLVFDQLKERTGGHVRFFVAGGAALAPEIGRFFQSAGLTILEGYGLTETSPVISCNKVGDERIGTVGYVMPEVTVGIQRLEDNEIIEQVSGDDPDQQVTSEAGEILVKGPNVMKGYWNMPEATKEMIDEDGWLHTGDVGRFVDGRLQITDRIKHMIVNAGGKNVYPGPIEDYFKTSKWIEQMVVVGEKQNFMAALIVPDFDALKEYASQEGISFSKQSELLEDPKIKEIFSKEVKAMSRELSQHEKIRDFRLLDKSFTVENGELTPTLKVKRKVVEKEYKHLIDDIFSNKN